MLLGGLVSLTTPIWAGSANMMNGYNLVLVLQWPLLIGGGAWLLTGSIRMLRYWLLAAPGILLTED